MQRLNFQLRLALELDKPHRWSRRCLRNRLGNPLVAFLGLYIGSHAFWQRQAHPMPLLSDLPPEMVRPAARLHRDRAYFQPRRESQQRVSPQAPAQHHESHLIAAHERDPRVKVIDLSRNFGKEYALTAGLDHCDADAVVVMDSDLQHPPEMLPAMIAEMARRL